MNQFKLEEAMMRRAAADELTQLRELDRAVVKPLEISEAPTIRTALDHYKRSTLEEHLNSLDHPGQDHLWKLLLAYQRRIARKEDQGALTTISSYAAPISITSTSGGLVGMPSCWMALKALQSPSVIARLAFQAPHKVLAAQRIAVCTAGLASCAAATAGLYSLPVTLSLGLGCEGYEYLKWRRAHGAVELVREKLGLEPLPVIKEAA